MKFTLKIFGLGLLMLHAAALPVFAKGEAARAALQPKVVDLNQVDLEQVEDNWDNASPVPPVSPNRGMKIKDIVEPTNEYTYASFGKPDPFAYPSLRNKGFGGGEGLAVGVGPGDIPIISTNEISIRSPLQSYPIEALVVKGVYQLSDGDMRAMILTPKNEGIVVKNGDPMSSGKVIKIEKDALVVRLYRIRKDGVREYDDKRIMFGMQVHADKGTIKLAPGKVAQFPGMEAPADHAANVEAAFPAGGVPPNSAVVPGDAKGPIVGIPGGVGAPGYVPPDKAAANSAAAASTAAAAAAAAAVIAQPPGAYLGPAKSAEPESGRPGANRN